MTVAEIRTLTKQALGNRTSGALTTAWWTDRVNAGYRRLATFQGLVTRPGMKQPQFRVLRFFELEDRQAKSLTTSLTDNFVTPTGNVTLGPVYVVQDIFNRTNNKPLWRPSRRQMLRLDPDATGIPQRWLPAGKNGVVGYYIDRRPSTVGEQIDVYEYTYHAPAAYATNGTDDTKVPIIPTDWHVAIHYAATQEAAQLIDMPEKASEFEERFITFIAERKSPREEATYNAAGSYARNVRVGPVPH